MINRVSDIVTMLPEYTDKVYASPPTDGTIRTADDLLGTLPPKFRKVLSINSLSLSQNHGRSPSVVIDWWGLRRSFVSVSINEDEITFYADMPDGSIPEGTFKFKGVCPAPIVSALEELYGRAE